MKELLAKAAQQAVFRVDSWLNVLTGLGVGTRIVWPT